MSRLPFSIVTEATPRPGDRIDAALYYGATIAAIAALLAGGGGAGYLIVLWLFN